MKDSKSKKYGIVIDASKCIDCKACLIACKVENNVPEGFWRNWIRPLWDIRDSHRTEFQPGQCMQCDTPSCVAACPVEATYKQANGLVVIDPQKCIGCGNCVTACPYGARYRDPATRRADKCDFCEHRLKRGEQPANPCTLPAFKSMKIMVNRIMKRFDRTAARFFNTPPRRLISRLGCNMLSTSRVSGSSRNRSP